MNNTSRIRQERYRLVAAVLTLISAMLFNTHFVLKAWSFDRSVNKPNYSYIEFDFPPSLLPLSKHPYSARLTVEDTVHYQFNDTEEWQSIFPPGGGFVRLGPENRMFGISMFHQLHCLDKMRRAIVREPPSEWEKSHTQHCLNYIRQMILCASNTRLENVKESEAGLKVDGLGLEHKCRDWSALYAMAEENHSHWPEDIYP